MDTTTIRLPSKVKENIKELVSYLSFKAKRILTQGEVISLITELGIEQKDQIAQKLLDETKNSQENLDDPFFSLPCFDLGHTDSSNVDAIIYKRDP